MAHRRTEADDPGRRVGAALSLLTVLAALVMGAALATLPGTAAAVTPVASEPQDRERVSDPPGAVTLAFSRDVDPSVAKVIVVGPDGQNVTSGTLIVEGTNVTSRLQDGLPRGTYTVHFRVDAKNGDLEGGAYQFAYGSGSFTTPPDRSWSGESNEPAILRGSNPNGSEQPDPPSTSAPETPGIEVTTQAPTSAPPPPTDRPSTVEPPPDSTTGAASAPQTSVSPTPESSSGGGSPWVIGGILLLVALAGTGFGVWHSRRNADGGDHA